MRGKFISVWVIIAMTSALAQVSPGNPSQWQRIYPVKDCTNFHLVYVKQGDQFFITYPMGEANRLTYKSPYITVKSINDLSGIADLINAEVQKKCSPRQSNAVGPGEDCAPMDNLEPAFIKLVQDAANAVGKSGDRCQELTRYIELHDKIVDLDPKNPVQIREASEVVNSLLKVFTSETDSKLIDQFEECGGQSNSHKFIENLLLVESHASCIMPRPPGILTWDQMRNLARKIGEKYRNKSILAIRDEKPEIEKDALLEITRLASVEQVKQLMPQADPDKTLESMESFKNLRQARGLKEFKDYIHLVFTPDATIEIAEKSLPGMVRENMMGKLPRAWSEEQKTKYIEDTLMPKAMEGFTHCMAAPRKNINYGHEASPLINLNYRKWQKDSFCKRFKSVCLQSGKTSCANKGSAKKGSLSVLSMNPNVTDSEVAKSCVMNGLSRTIEPIFSLVVGTQVENFKNAKLPPGLTTQFTQAAWDQFRGCINTHKIVRQAFPASGDYRPIYYDSGTNPQAFQKMTSENFKRLYADCSEMVEQKLTRDFVEVIFISNDNVSKNNPYGALVDFHGVKYPAGAVQYAQATVERVLDTCYQWQRENNRGSPGFKPTPSTCTPLLEMEVAERLIDKTLRRMFDDKKISKDPEAMKVLADFTACSSRATYEATKAAGNAKANPPLATQKDTTTYLEKDNRFYQCVENALIGTSKVVGGSEFRNALNKQQKTLANHGPLLKMEGQVREVVGTCFRQELTKVVDSWPKFKDFNARGGTKTIEATCAKAVSKYVIPRIMLKETLTQVQNVKSQGMIDSDKDVHSVIEAASQDIRSQFKIRANSKLKGDELLYSIFGEGLESYLRAHPKAGQDEYLAYFKDLVTARVIDKVHDKLITGLKNNANARYRLDLSALDGALTGQCLLQLYKNFASGKGQAARPRPSDGTPQEAPLNLNALTDQLVDGFWYLGQSPPPALERQIDRISNFCKDASSYSSLDSIKKSGLVDFLVKAQLHKKTVAAFKKIAQETYEAELKQYGKKPHFDKMRPFIEKKYRDMQKLIAERLEDREAFEKMIFLDGPSPIIDFTIQNMDEVAKEGSPSGKRLNQLVMQQMFSDRSKDSFASRFTAIQLVNTIGSEGYEEALNGIYRSVKDHPNIPDLVVKVGKQSLDNKWNVGKIRWVVGWNELPQAERENLISAVYDHAITPVVRGDDPATAKNEKARLAKKVQDHLGHSRRGGKNFKEMITEEIAADTKKEIKANHKVDALGETLSNWLPFLLP